MVGYREQLCHVTAIELNSLKFYQILSILNHIFSPNHIFLLSLVLPLLQYSHGKNSNAYFVNNFVDQFNGFHFSLLYSINVHVSYHYHYERLHA